MTTPPPSRGFVSLGLILLLVLGLAAFGGAGWWYVQEGSVLNMDSPQISDEIPTKHNDSESQETEQGPHFLTEGTFTHPAKDTVVIGSRSGETNITGWTIRSLETGKRFTIDTIKWQGQDREVHLSDGGGVFIATVGDLSKSYCFEAECHLYFGEPEVAWGLHDTLQLLDSNGIVVDTYRY